MRVGQAQLLCGNCGAPLKFPEEWEPAELRDLCNNPVFHALAVYCLGGRPGERHDSVRFDRDELGEDPEED